MFAVADGNAEPLVSELMNYSLSSASRQKSIDIIINYVNIIL